MDYSSIGKNIRFYRTLKRIKQDELAEKAGLSVNYVGMIERGEKIPSIEAFIRIVNALEVSADMVMCDVLNCGYQIKSSQLEDRIQTLSPKEKRRIFAVVATLVEFS